MGEISRSWVTRWIQAGNRSIEAPDDVVMEILIMESCGIAQTPGEAGGT